MDFLRRRKKDDFFCSAGWLEWAEVLSLDGGADDTFDGEATACCILLGSLMDLSAVLPREARLGSGELFWEELPPPKKRLKNPGRCSLAGAGAAFGDACAISFDFP
jgi:hypothetical protein